MAWISHETSCEKSNRRYEASSTTYADASSNASHVLPLVASPVPRAKKDNSSSAFCEPPAHAQDRTARLLKLSRLVCSHG